MCVCVCVCVCACVCVCVWVVGGWVYACMHAFVHTCMTRFMKTGPNHILYKVRLPLSNNNYTNEPAILASIIAKSLATSLLLLKLVFEACQLVTIVQIVLECMYSGVAQDKQPSSYKSSVYGLVMLCH